MPPMRVGEDMEHHQDSPPPVRKKFAKPPVKLACMTCRGSRVRCSGTQPCYRCNARGLTCIYGQSRRGLASRGPPAHDTGAHEADGLDHIDFDPSPVNILPALYTDSDPPIIHFDETWNPDLDEFFADLFATPSYPQAYALDVDVTSSMPVNRNLYALQPYQRNEDVIDAYYTFIHPSFPILPPPEKKHKATSFLQEDPPLSTSSPIVESLFAGYQPTSPLVLALLSLLVLFPRSNEGVVVGEEETQEMRCKLSQSLAGRALESIEKHTHGMQPVPVIHESVNGNEPWLHPRVPDKLEIPLSLCTLSVQDYLCNGNLPRMLHLAERALDVSMQLSLHQYEGEDPAAEAIRRAWWVSYLSYCNASIVNCKAPKSIDRSILKTPYPSSCGSQKVWEIHIRAEETLLAATLYLVALVKGCDQPSSISGFYEGAALLNDIIDAQMAYHCSLDTNQAQTPQISREDDAEAKSQRTLRIVTSVRLASAKIKVHRYCAFMGSYGLLEQFEHLPEEHSDTGALIPSLAFSWPGNDEISSSSGVSSLFPFSESESRQVCLDCALEINTHLATLRNSVHVPYFFCSTVQCAYTLLMVYFSHLDRRRSRPSQHNEWKGQCVRALESALITLRTFSATFLYVEKTYELVSRVHNVLLSSE